MEQIREAKLQRRWRLEQRRAAYRGEEVDAETLQARLEAERRARERLVAYREAAQRQPADKPRHAEPPAAPVARAPKQPKRPAAKPKEQAPKPLRTGALRRVATSFGIVALACASGAAVGLSRAEGDHPAAGSSATTPATPPSGQALAQPLVDLAQTRSSELRAFRDATRAAEQAAAARRLSRAYRRGANRLRVASVSPEFEPARRGLIARTSTVARAYAGLAEPAQAGRKSAYASRLTAVERAESRLAQAIERLRR